MKFFGLDVNIKRAAEPNQVQRKKLSSEIGDTGTRIVSGIVNEDYNTSLSGQTGVSIFNEMLRNDGTVASVVKVTSLPIRSAEFYIEAGSQENTDQDIADFVDKALFELVNETWDYILYHALLSMPYGVMAFEKVFGTVELEGRTYIIWKKISPRIPKSIYRWELSNGELGIVQSKSNGEQVEIPISKLIVIVNDREGNNWWGNSILRAAYKHWNYKNVFYKIDSIAFERQGIGIPKAKMPENYPEQDKKDVVTVLQNMRANHQSFIVEPHDWELSLMDMKGNSVRDPQNSINHHNREITKCVLAQFLELGQTTGSKALSEDHSKLFIQSLETVARNICGEFNKAIRELVDFNFDGVKEYPKLMFTGINEVDVDKLASAYDTLVKSGGIIPGTVDERFWRETMYLPKRDENDVVEIKETKKEDNSKDDTKKKDDEDIEMSECGCSKKKVFSDGEYSGYRKLTAAETKVDYVNIEKQIDKLELTLGSKAKVLLQDARKTYIDKITKASLENNAKAIKAARIEVTQEYERIINDALKNSYEAGKKQAAKELGLADQATSREVLRNIDIEASALADTHIAEITARSKSAYTQALNKTQSTALAVAAADKVANELIDTLVNDTTRIVVSTHINYGRNDVFENNRNKIYALQRSEILDYKTCPYCLSVDGRVVNADDSYTQNTIFHSSCRGIWVAIKNDEKEKPSIGGIPQSVRDRFGDNVNDLLQPKTPIVNKNSPAAREVERREKRKKK